MEIRRSWLHRRGRKTWMFESSKDCKVMSHTTNRGSTYAIMDGMNCGIPFYIAKLSGDKVALFIVDKEIGAMSIEFENGGKYIF